MKQKDLKKIYYNSLNNFFSEFIIMNKLHNNKIDNNVISFGIYIDNFKFVFLIKKNETETIEQIEEMLFEIQAEIGYHYNLTFEYEIIIDIEKYKAILNKKNFECIYLRPDIINLQNLCKPKNIERIKYFFDKYVYKDK